MSVSQTTERGSARTISSTAVIAALMLAAHLERRSPSLSNDRIHPLGVLLMYSTLSHTPPELIVPFIVPFIVCIYVCPETAMTTPVLLLAASRHRWAVRARNHRTLPSHCSYR
ncbi:hypothetical protein Mapa_010388 [Marchantia paleacea]|nr:hypothetical protein Mapa_010388 [Marchantia paleacea]